MLEKKRFITQLDTDNPSIYMALDIDKSVLQLLREKFAGRCFQGCYIVDVIEINKRSPMLSEWNRSGGSFTCHVEFLVNCVVYNKGDIIPDAKIVGIMSNGMFILNFKYGSIGLPPSPKLQLFKMGQIIPVRVSDISYEAYRTGISCIAQPLLPQIEEFDEKEFYIKASVKKDNPLLSDVQELLTKVSNLDKPKLKKYNDMKEILMPYKSKGKPSAGFKITPLEDVKEGIVMRPAWLEDQPVCLYKAEVVGDKEHQNGESVLEGYLNSVKKQITSTLDLIDTYEIDNSTKHIWQLYIADKKP